MISRNILNPVIEENSFYNSDFLWSRITNYSNTWDINPYFIAPSSVNVRTSNQQSAETRLIYHEYDKWGNPVYVSKDDMTKVVYLWSYCGRYPVAEITNATYSEVVNALGQSTIHNFSLQLSFDEDVHEFVAPLRTCLPNSMITTYTYKPEVGITSATDPSGRSIYYEYDHALRLIKIIDDEHNTIKEYSYNYQQ